MTTDLDFQIVYKDPNTGENKSERIKANSHSHATEICKGKGEHISIKYIEKNTDLLYLH